ncbi:hypothetical protein SLS54_006518 [Diplodia seriata]
MIVQGNPPTLLLLLFPLHRKRLENDKLMMATALSSKDRVVEYNWVPIKSEAAASAAGDEKDKQIEALQLTMRQMGARMMQRDLRRDEAEMKWFNMDATFSVMTADRDMAIMHFDVAEMHRKRLEMEKAIRTLCRARIGLLQPGLARRFQ